MLWMLKMQKPHQRETIMAIKNHPSQIDGRTNYGRLKFNTDLFMSERPSQSGRIHLVQLLDSLTIPFEGNFLLTDYQLVVACQILRSRRLSKTTLSMPQIQIFMDNIHRWYQYWNTNAKIDLKSLNNGKVLRCEFVLPLFLLYVEMIISIIPFKQELPLNVELDYPQEMRNAIKSFMELNKILNNPPENGEYKFLMEKRNTFKVIVAHARSRPSAILWTFLDFWMKSHYTAVWNKVKEFNDLHSCDAVKTFFNYIFTRGIETLNQKIRDYLPHE
ncbi:uncharacterized protein VP01_2264g4 [Puccinia sorghi]|uniref:Uncharacterized protein n=1 Tax=Puccinia sorghi TaxID=27349 RepID=A0A0L6VA62_9BASI|nr:uncharacterized protein VP01_2264g4 [Puccinia sorghi]